MDPFPGFNSGTLYTPVPNPFFGPLLEHIQDMAELKVAPILEIKAEKNKGRQVAEAVLACLAKSPAAHKRDLLISSYNEEVLAVFCDSAPEFPRALVVRRIRRGWRKLAGHLGCREIHGNRHYLTRTAIREVTEAGLPVCAFTVDDAAHASRLLGWGVARIISNVPYSLLSPA